ncbi:MAG TPA: membrane protein insertion efficiency factor YidD [Candidatus Eisenbacteria bacterium]|nr:membrane protein insertion efficiency factor YidD [Candidatus Eisenbacteria bacterium]
MSASALSSPSYALRWLLLRLIRLYRAAISPSLPRSCRFEPSCAAYAEEAMARRPLRRAFILIVGRILRCHPFHPGGYDPVP